MVLSTSKLRLSAMFFVQFFIWGSWLITIGNYWFSTKGWSSGEFGMIYSTMGIAALMGMVTDRWFEYKQYKQKKYENI